MNHLHSSQYVLREPRNVEELEALLRLRYTVFQQNELRFLLAKNQYNLDIDAWDKHALHVGLFKRTSDAWQPVGYMRFIRNNSERFHLLSHLGEKYPDLKEVIESIPPASHPFLKRISNFVSPDDFYALQSLASSGNLAETSRFSLIKNENSPSVCRFLMESGTAICLFCRDLALVFESAAHHASCYERYGFEAVSKYKYQELPWETVLIKALPMALGQKFKARLRGMADAFEKVKEVWFYPDDPGNYGAPQNLKTPVYAPSELKLSKL